MDTSHHATPADPVERPHVEETILATSRYLAALTVLDDAKLRAPSLLPGWSRAHVVTHLSRNADGLVRLLSAARTGSDDPMYDSQERRDADIEAGASRGAAELRADAEASEARYREALARMTPEAWEAQVRRVPGGNPFPVSEVPRMRRTEIEVHHADLGIGYTAGDWPPDFVAAVIGRVRGDRRDAPPMVLRATDTQGSWALGDGSGGPEISGPEADLAWWLLGRGSGLGLVSSAGEVPDLGRWR